MSKHIFNRTFAFGISRKALVAMAILATLPTLAMAGPAPASIAPAASAAGQWSAPGTQQHAPASMAPAAAAFDQFPTPAPVPPAIIVTQAPVNISSFAVTPASNNFG